MSEAKHNCVRATERGEELWSENDESNERESETEATPIEASMHIDAKLLLNTKEPRLQSAADAAKGIAPIVVR